MAVNASRSMNGEMSAGRTDGQVQKIAKDRGGVIDAGTLNARASLHADYGYGRQDRTYLEMQKAEHMHGDEALS